MRNIIILGIALCTLLSCNTYTGVSSSTNDGYYRQGVDNYFYDNQLRREADARARKLKSNN